MIPPRPITIEDRVPRSDVAMILTLDADKVDELAQEINSLMHTLGGSVVHIRAYPAVRRDEDHERGAGVRP